MYFVCSREEDDCKKLYGGAWGYYWNREEAVDAVHRNVTDMHEALYPYASIEHLEPGLFPVPKERVWFGWDEEKDGFHEIETPDCDKYFPKNFSVALGAIGDENPRYVEEHSEAIDDETPCYFIMAMSNDDKDGERVRRLLIERRHLRRFKKTGEILMTVSMISPGLNVSRRISWRGQPNVCGFAGCGKRWIL